MMYKNSRWAKEIISLQKKDGSWGYFHTLSEPNKYPITTEQAIRRLQILGYTIDDPCIQKAIQYMHECLTGKKETPDRREKTHDWDIFTQLMLSTWIRRFVKDDTSANATAKTWAYIVSTAFKSGIYSHNDYLSAYSQTFSQKAKGGRIIDFISFYQVSLLSDCLESNIESAVFNYIINHENGIYYIYNKSICNVPEIFETKESSRYIGAIELLSDYKNSIGKLAFVVEWLMENKNLDNKWDLGSNAKDFIYFPLSDSWKSEARISDCTYRIEKLLDKIDIGGQV
ncbi:MAG: hypothetical protein EWM47_11745 [Anaerolineaceae bacterium]|nr:MAG: hypothetical protein EWM47_11745 [Anaerolineaceae bacterium]